MRQCSETSTFSWAAFTELSALAGGQSPRLRTGSLLLAAAPSASSFAARAVRAIVVAHEATAVVVADEAATVMVADEAATIVVADEAAAVVVADEAACSSSDGPPGGSSSGGRPSGFTVAWGGRWSEEVMSTFVVLYGVDHFGSSVVLSYRESPQRRRSQRAIVSRATEICKSARPLVES